MFELTKDQDLVFSKVMERINKEGTFSPDFSFITIGGYAGTGKTFLISIIRKEIKEKYENTNVAFVTFTGKASSVLNLKLKENESLYDYDYCGTIHSLIYKPEMKYDKKLKRMVIIKWVKRDDINYLYDLIFLDEASMVDINIWKDLLSYNIPIIAVGDHGQLPPINGSFNLMFKPEYTLTEIKRQTLENPIIRLTQDIRNGKEIPFGFYDKDNPNVFKLYWKSDDCKNIFEKLDFMSDDLMILCGMNRTRNSINRLIRNKLNFALPEPYPGEKVVFLKNNYKSNVLNGLLGKILLFEYEDKNLYNLTVKFDSSNDIYSGIVFDGFFGKETYDLNNEILISKEFKKRVKKSGYETVDYCDFAYAITVHKAQGSEFNKCIIFQERGYYWNDEYMRRWLYTACSRAKEKLFIIM